MMTFWHSDADSKLAALSRSQAIIEFKPDGTIITANKKFLDIMGYNLDEVCGRGHDLFIEPAVRSTPTYRAFWNDLRQGEFKTAEFRRIGKGDREVWIQGTYNPVLDRAGRVTKVVKFAIDITAQKQRGLDLDGQLAALHRSQAIIAFTPEGTIIDANANFLTTLGYRLEEIKGRHHSIFVAETERSGEDYRAFWAGLAHGEYQAAEYRRITKDGSEVFIQGTYNPITDADGRVLKVVKFATDVTEQVRHRQRRAEAQQAIGTDLDAIGDFVVNGNATANDAEWWSGFLPADSNNFMFDGLPGMDDMSFGLTGV